MCKPNMLLIKIARKFYSSNLPFHLAMNLYYRKTFSYAVSSSNINWYIPLSYNKLRTTFPTKERSHVENLLHAANKKIMELERGKNY